MAKLANPWKCDNSSCGILRANDTNHWLQLSVLDTPEEKKYLVVKPWSDVTADIAGVKHACGIDCGLKIAAQLMVEHFFPGDAAKGATS